MDEPSAAEPAPPAPTDCVVAGSSGRVDNPLAYDTRTFRAEPGGLFSTEVFGPIPWEGEPRVTEDARSDRWGHIELPVTVPHPDDPTVPLAHVPVTPPAHRRYVQLTAEQTHAWARRTRDAVLAQEASGAVDDPARTLLGEQGLWSLEHDRPLDDAEIAAMPPVAREATATGLYRRVVNLAHAIRRLAELEAPVRVRDDQRARLSDAVQALFAHLATAGLPPEVAARARARCVIEAAR